MVHISSSTASAVGVNCGANFDIIQISNDSGYDIAITETSMIIDTLDTVQPQSSVKMKSFGGYDAKNWDSLKSSQMKMVKCAGAGEANGEALAVGGGQDSNQANNGGRQVNVEDANDIPPDDDNNDDDGYEGNEDQGDGDRGGARNGVAGNRPNTIVIYIQNMRGERIYFRVRRTTPMSRVFSAYARRVGVRLGSFRFIHRGQPIDTHSNETPGTLGLENNSRISAILQLRGTNSIVIRLLCQTGEITCFRVRRTTPMSLVFGAWAGRRGMHPGSFRFLQNGETIDTNATPDTLVLEMNSLIHVVQDLRGGGKRSDVVVEMPIACT